MYILEGGCMKYRNYTYIFIIIFIIGSVYFNGSILSMAYIDDNNMFNISSIDVSNMYALDDNYYLDNDSIVDLRNNSYIDYGSLIIDSNSFNNLVYSKLRLKYPKYIVDNVVSNDYKIEYFNDKIDVVYNDESNTKVSLICRDIKDIIVYDCVDDIEDESNGVDVNINSKIVALTFDDGPCKYTREVMNKLLDFNMKATFFELGSMMVNYPEIVKELRDNGFEIGSHGYSHKSFVKLGLNGTLSELEETNNIYKSITGEDLKLVRPPYGAYNEEIKLNSNSVLIRWNVDSLDWKVKDDRYIENVMSVVKDGDIILAHDIHKSTLDGLDTLLTRLYEEGFQVVSVSDLAKARGISLEKNNVYYKLRNA